MTPLQVSLEGPRKAKIPDVIPISRLRREASEVARQIRASARPVIVTQRGHGSLVLIDLQHYQALEETRTMVADILASEEDIKAGRLHDMTDVRKRIHATLKRHEEAP